MFRSISRLGFLGAISPLTAFAFAEWQFDTKGFETHQRDAGGVMKFEKPLVLTGVGMRKKNLYVVAVDVYMAAAFLSPSAVANAKAWKSGTIADAVLSANSNTKSPQAAAIVTLRFVRDVGASNLKGAFNEILSGLPLAEINAFTEQVGASVGAEGVKNGEDILFVWMEGGGLSIVCKGKAGHIDNPAVEKKLLDGYLDAEKGVSPDLRKCFADNIANIVV